MKLLKYLSLFLVLCNIPGYLVAYFGPSLGSLSSYLSSLSMIAFFVLTKDRHKPLFPFIALGLLYFLISAINYTHIDVDNFFIKEFIRFMIVVVCGAEVAYRTTTKDIYFIIFLGGISVLINALIFPLANVNFYPTFGRYSGFYLNPNFAAGICLIGYAISFSITKRTWMLIGQFIFTLAGILTFSRSFILVWLTINFFAILQNKKNIIVPAVGIMVLILVFTFSDKLTLHMDRFNALKSIFGEEQVDTKTINKDTRDETWALYYDMVLDRPFIGNGWRKLSDKYQGKTGAHNSFLMIFGEAGILPLLLMLGIYGYLLVKSFSFFKSRPELFYIAVVLVLSLMTGHGYFDNFYNVFISMYLFIELRKIPLKKNNYLTLLK